MEPRARGRTLAALALAQTLDETPPRGLGSEPALASGSVLLRRIVVGRRLGFGPAGLGSIYEASHPEVKEGVALHVLPASSLPPAGPDPRVCERLCSVVHPSVVRVREILPGPERSRIVVRELIRGATVRRLLDRARKARAVVHWPDAARIASAVLEGLEHLHRKGFWHPCLTPDTVLVDGRGSVRLTGHVLGDLVEATELQAHAVAMDPAYLAPEARVAAPAPGDLDAQRRIDVYAAGALLTELLTAAPPRDAAPALERAREDAPPGLDALLRRALHPDPRQRFATAAEMGLALRALRPPCTSSERRAAITPEVERSHPLLRVAALCLAVAAVFAIAALLAGRAPPPPAGEPPAPAVAERR